MGFYFVTEKNKNVMRKPFIMQHDSMQCGVACLGMICRYYGKNYSLKVLSNYCHASHEGVSILGISQAAEKIGLETKCIRTDIKTLIQIKQPCILHWNQNHFVVYYGKDKKGKFVIADPGKGIITYDEKVFESYWTKECSSEKKGVLLLLQTTPFFHTHEEKEMGVNHLSCFFLKFIKKIKRPLTKVFLLAAFASCLQLLLPFLTQAIVDMGIAQEDLNLIYIILIGQLVLTISRSIADFIRNRILLHIGLGINISIVDAFFSKLLQLPMGFFETKLQGDLYQRLVDHDRIKDFLTSQLLNIFFAVISLAVFAIVLLNYSGIIFLIFLFGTLINGAWLIVLMRKRRNLDYQSFEQQADNNNKIYQFLSSMQEIKLQGCETRRRQEWVETQKSLFAVSQRKLKLEQFQELGSILINETKNIIVNVMAASSVISGEMTLGMMLAIQYIIGQLNMPVTLFAQFIHSLQDVQISLERINEVHEMEAEDGTEKKAREYAYHTKEISISNVCFKYDPHSSKEILRNVSADIPENKITAIVGASGSGKTTLVKLLLGYYPPSSGCIILSGAQLHNYNLKWWRERCGAVMQDGVMFSESIARNIAVGDGEINWDRLYESAKIACVDEFVKTLPLGYQTKIGRDGVGLSKGQHQRILIARAVYKQPDFLMLDEATNSLDAKNEREIVDNLSEFYKNRTVIIVAHRLSTVKDADNILVMDHGCIVEQGTHENLTEKKGVYFNLVKNQLELGQ